MGTAQPAGHEDSSQLEAADPGQNIGEYSATKIFFSPAGKKIVKTFQD